MVFNPEDHGTGKPEPVKRRKGGRSRFPMFNAAVDFAFAEAGLKLSDRMTWVVLWRHANAESVSTVSHKRIAVAAGFSLRTAYKAVDRLAEAGFLKFVKKGHTDRPNTYRLRVPS